MSHTEIVDYISEALSGKSLSVQMKNRWNEVSLEENLVPKIAEMPEICLKDHIVGMTSRSINCELKLDGRIKRYPFLAGEAMIMPARNAFTANFDFSHVSTALHLSDQILRRNALELWDTDSFELIPACPTQDALAANIIEVLCTALRTQLEEGSIYAQTMGNALAVHLLINYSTHTKPTKLAQGKLSPKKLKLVVEFIDENLDKDLNLTTLASLVRLSQYHFSRAFKRSTNLSPHQYVIQKRVERAKYLLKQSNFTINEIAIECGFANPSHFAKYFRKQAGIAPSEFRIM